MRLRGLIGLMWCAICSRYFPIGLIGPIKKTKIYETTIHYTTVGGGTLCVQPDNRKPSTRKSATPRECNIDLDRGHRG